MICSIHSKIIFFLLVLSGYSCVSVRRAMDAGVRSSFSHSSLFPWDASPAWSAGTAWWVLVPAATDCSGEPHEARAQFTRYLFLLFHVPAQAGLGRGSCPALDFLCALSSFLVTHVSVTKSLSQALLAATSVEALWDGQMVCKDPATLSVKN